MFRSFFRVKTSAMIPSIIGIESLGSLVFVITSYAQVEDLTSTRHRSMILPGEAKQSKGTGSNRSQFGNSIAARVVSNKQSQESPPRRRSLRSDHCQNDSVSRHNVEG